ncbi:type I toxin-antitoxin system Fst family toxin [Ligilactobacillus aviarius]|nr:type I toxin-antitoxin system Fst family toxin [Ligilactobacillus aviarius]
MDGQTFLSLIIAPVIVNIITELFKEWLKNHNK